MNNNGLGSKVMKLGLAIVITLITIGFSLCGVIIMDYCSCWLLLGLSAAALVIEGYIAQSYSVEFYYTGNDYYE